MTSVPTKPRTGSIVVPKMAEPDTSNEQQVNNGAPTSDDWKTERQLVSSLAKLQELETMVGFFYLYSHTIKQISINRH